MVPYGALPCSRRFFSKGPGKYDESENPSPEGLRVIAARVAERLYEGWFKEEADSSTLSLTARIFFSGVGALTMLSFALLSGRIKVLEKFFDGVAPSSTSTIDLVATIGVLLSSIVLPPIIAVSVEKGRPLRFFLLGLLLYSFVVGVTSLGGVEPEADRGMETSTGTPT